MKGPPMLRPALVAISAFSLAVSAVAQPGRIVQEPPRGVSGTVVSLAEESVVLKQADGATKTVAMTKGWTVGKLRKAMIDELRLGDFIGSANADLGPDSGRANELRVFEPGYQPEYGTHAIATAGTSMTHGFVFDIAKRAEGTLLDIAYPGGHRAVLVAQAMSITITDLQPRASAAPGVAVSAVTRAGSDGVHRASRLVLAERAEGERK
jgi:hypothetical protein